MARPGSNEKSTVHYPRKLHLFELAALIDAGLSDMHDVFVLPSPIKSSFQAMSWAISEGLGAL